MSWVPQAGFEPTAWDALECLNRVACVAEADSLHRFVGNKFYHAFGLPLIPDTGSDCWCRSPHAPDVWALPASATFCTDGADENRPMRPSTSVGGVRTASRSAV